MKTDGMDQEQLRALLESSQGQGHWVLRLYVTGTTAGALRAIENVRRICDEYLERKYDLQVIDIYQQPLAAEEAQIFAAPTLVKEQPLPVKRLIGDMSDTGKVLIALAIQKK